MALAECQLADPEEGAPLGHLPQGRSHGGRRGREQGEAHG